MKMPLLTTVAVFLSAFVLLGVAYLGVFISISTCIFVLAGVALITKVVELYRNIRPALRLENRTASTHDSNIAAMKRGVTMAIEKGECTIRIDIP